MLRAPCPRYLRHGFVDFDTVVLRPTPVGCNSEADAAGNGAAAVGMRTVDGEPAIIFFGMGRPPRKKMK